LISAHTFPHVVLQQQHSGTVIRIFALEVFLISLLAAAVSCYCFTHTGAQAEAISGTVLLTIEPERISNHERVSH
jgi:hypothetical protein